MEKPLISILTPFKNTSIYLEACLVSIIKQTYKNWELLIVDDGSTDHSYELVNSFVKKDFRIKLFKNSGNGIIEALRMAFNNSSGQFITRMDSDDIMLPNKLDIMAGSLLKHGHHHVAIGLVKYFCDGYIGEGYKAYETWLNNLTKVGNNYQEIYKECVIPSPCWMIHREDLLACDSFIPNVYPEDYDLTFRFYKHQFKCIPCDIILHKWRDYNTRTSRTHEHYAQNHFTTLKTTYFLDLDYNKQKTLVLWGAGNKGKIMAKLLIERKVPFEWICDNPNKIGRDIYGKILKPFSYLEEIKNTQSAITVANKKSQREILQYMNKLNKKPITDFVFFC